MNKSLTKTNDALQQEKLPKKYIFLLFFLLISSTFYIGASVYKNIKYEKIKNLFHADGIIAVGIFIILYTILLKYFKLLLKRNTIIKMNLIFITLLVMKYVYTLFQILKIGFSCPLPHSNTFEQYKACQENIASLIRIHALNYNIFIIFVVSFISFLILFNKTQSKENSKYLKLYILLFSITIIIPVLIEYIFSLN